MTQIIAASLENYKISLPIYNGNQNLQTGIFFEHPGLSLNKVAY
jgi:hypothetical protein